MASQPSDKPPHGVAGERVWGAGVILEPGPICVRLGFTPAGTSSRSILGSHRVAAGGDGMVVLALLGARPRRMKKARHGRCDATNLGSACDLQVLFKVGLMYVPVVSTTAAI